MSRPFSHLSDKAIAEFILTMKGAIEEMIDMGEDAHKAAGRPCPPAGMFSILTGFIEAFESEVRARGMDPQHEAFGPDILGMLAEEKVRLLLDAQ